MSVICQNFVQNAWKKDLCSNCFKSVGDHCGSLGEVPEHPRVQIMEEKDKGRPAGGYVSPSGDVTNVSSPHTTWKSLTSDKNVKNSPVFKLEAGFRGRLLTINNVSEKNVKPFLTNGNANVTSAKISRNGLGKAPRPEESPKSHSDNSAGESPVTNGTPLQSILKKPKSPQSNSPKKSSRRGNVGFREDDPVVIGYGGRDFTPEELDWEMGSDWDVGGSVDSLDETEEDKVMSKITQENTEFNSDVANLLSESISKAKSVVDENKGNRNVKEVVNHINGNSTPKVDHCDIKGNSGKQKNEIGTDKVKVHSSETSNKDIVNNIKISSKNRSESNSSSAHSNQKGNSKQSPSNMGLDSKDKKSVKFKSEKPEEINSQDIKGQVNNVTNNSKDRNNKNKCYGRSSHNDYQYKSSNSEDLKNASKVDVSTKNRINGGGTERDFSKGERVISTTEDTLSQSMDSLAESDSAVSTESEGAEPVVVTDAKDKNTATCAKGAGVGESVSKCVVKNSTISDISCSSNGAEVCGGDSDSFTSCRLGCSSDNLQSWDGNVIIHQAVNSSLTNSRAIYEGNLMSDAGRLSMASLGSADSDGTPSNPNEEGNCVVTFEAKELENSSEVVCEQPLSGAGGMAEQEKRNFGKPRTSFLHGTKEESKEQTSPSAVYSPASDLFVTNSNSSSSSDECEHSEGTLTEMTDKAESDEMSDDLKSASETIPRLVSDQPETFGSMTENGGEIGVSYPNPTKKKQRPEIPEKPHPKSRSTAENPYAVPFTKTQQSPSYGIYDNYAKTDGSVYYSAANGNADSKKVPLVSHYAESNIYQEINNGAEIIFDQDGNKIEPGVERESKLAALAIELEQARCTNGNIKRQAPAPPRLSAPQLDDSHRSASRNSSPIDSCVPVQVYRSDSVPFSSSSSTASSSSQDTDIGYSASWNLHSDFDSHSKHPRGHSSSKPKSSFLLNQYSKCKMLALGYVEDAGGKSKKKFSLKKLLKIGKESDGPTTFDSNYPNPKAWKYSENFDRPRAKLEIIHPMDLEDKNITVNPGFRSIHMTSVGSFTPNINNSMDPLSNRISTFSDFDTFSAGARGSQNPDSKSDSQDSGDYGMDDYSCNSNTGQTTPGRNTPHSGNSGNSSPPSPSRLSTASLSSTATSSSSRNGIPVRPPKPPPPPRAHSLLPGNRNGRSNNGMYKADSSSQESSNTDESETLPPKPQAPKRQYRQGVKSDYVNFEPKVQEKYQVPQTEDKPSAIDSANETVYKLLKHAAINENDDDLQYQDVALVQDDDPLRKATEKCDSLTNVSCIKSSKETLISSENVNLNSSTETGKLSSVAYNNQMTLCTKTINDANSECGEKIYQPSLQRNKHPPLTKAPSRPPPMYAKSQHVLNAKEKPWKSLEGSYAALASSNREVLIKLIDEGMKSRPNLFQEIHRNNLQWEDFQLDSERSAVVFAFGDKVVYDAVLTCNVDFLVTLVISIQQQSSGLGNYKQSSYPVLGCFNSYVPSNLLIFDSQEDSLENAMVHASVCVLHRAEVTTIENFVEDLSGKSNDEEERELCFILLQLIHGLKSLQAQGIEAIDASFQNLILAKTSEDNLHTLVFLSETFFDDVDNAYSSIADNSKVSLCQYALMLLCQLKKSQNTEALILSAKVTNSNTSQVFENVVKFLMQEKAVSLSQTKTLLECYLWGIHTLSQDEGLESQDYDVVLQRWIDIERSNFIKSIVGDSLSTDFSSLDQYHSQFLVRTNARTIKEVLSFR